MFALNVHAQGLPDRTPALSPEAENKPRLVTTAGRGAGCGSEETQRPICGMMTELSWSRIRHPVAR